MELYNYYDRYDTGLAIDGKKDIRHNGKQSARNDTFFGPWTRFTPSSDAYLNAINRSELNYRRNEVSDTMLNETKIFEHITGQVTRYGTMNPFSPVRVLGVDCDNHSKPKQFYHMIPVLFFLQEYYPKCFYDDGSSGKSLHYYIKLLMSELYDYFISTGGDNNEWSGWVNTLIAHTGDIFSYYVKYFIPTNNTGFDAFKATYPQYKVEVQNDGTFTIQGIVKDGVLHKLPNIFTVQDLITFRDSPVYPFSYHLSLSLFFAYSLLLSNSLTSAEIKKVRKAVVALEPVLHGLNGTAAAPAPTTILIEEEKDKERLGIYGSTFTDIDDIRAERDSFQRSRDYFYYCYMYSMITRGREPNIDEYKEGYITDVGIREGDETRKDRLLEYVYETNIERLRKYAFGSIEQQIHVFMEKMELSQKQIDVLSTYDRKIRRRDIAIAAIWIGASLNKPVNYKSVVWNNHDVHYSRELTAPMRGLKGFFAAMKEKGLSKTGCNDRKAKALRKVLEQIGWIQIVDRSYIRSVDTNDGEGRSWRYILLDGHPGYDRFKQMIGESRIQFWKAYQDKVEMKQSG